MIPYGRQDINQDDIDAVVEVLRSNFLTQGPAVLQFEHAVANSCGSRYGVAVNSATSALHIACLALGVGPGDVVWTSPITFVASANCARYCGADVDFVDIDPVTLNLSAEKLAAKLIQARQEGGRLPKVVIPVHFAGQSCDMVAIAKLAEEFDFRIVEDASHAIGGHYHGEPVGNGRYSDITVFSFHPVKIITTGEGGIAVTQRVALAEHMGRLRSHGITRDLEQMTHAPDGPWYYQQIELGYNYRITDIQAALGSSQLHRLRKFVIRRQELAAWYDTAFAHTIIRPQTQQENVESAYHLYVVRVPAARRLSAFEALREQGIGVNLHYIPVYLQPDFRKLGFTEGYCPEAEAYYQEAITLPLYPSMTVEDQTRIANALVSLVSDWAGE